MSSWVDDHVVESFPLIDVLLVRQGAPDPPDREVVARWLSYPQDKQNLLGGLEWFLRTGCDVLNVSLGFGRDPFDANEPLQVATRRLSERGVVVVVAAGNDGPEPGSLQSLAQAPWVIAVAAVDEAAAPLTSSSRGLEPLIPDPAMAASGIDWNSEPMAPGTSFAAPRVSRLAAIVKQVLHLTARSVHARKEGLDNGVGPTVSLPVIGFVDTGVDPEKYEAGQLGPVARSLLSSDASAFQLGFGKKEAAWCDAANSLFITSGVSQVVIDGALVKKVLQASATASEHPRAAVGAGVVDFDGVYAWLAELTPQRFVGLFAADPPADEPGDPLPLFDTSELDVLIDLLGSGQQTKMARVVE